MNLVPFVPDHHTHDFIVVAPIQSRSRTACLRCRYLRGPLQPAARGLMNGFVELASRRVRQGATALMRDRDILQSNFSRADAVHRVGAYLPDRGNVGINRCIGGERTVPNLGPCSAQVGLSLCRRKRDANRQPARR